MRCFVPSRNPRDPHPRWKRPTVDLTGLFGARRVLSIFHSVEVCDEFEMDVKALAGCGGNGWIVRAPSSFLLVLLTFSVPRISSFWRAPGFFCVALEQKSVPW